MFLPLRLVAVQALKATEGPFASYLPFLALFTGGCALATRYRQARWMPGFVVGGALLAALAQAALSDGPGEVMVGVSIFMALGVALRIIGLAVRDWRNPVTSSFGWGSIILLVEVAAANSAQAGWEPLLPIIVPLFFAASLASRAVSVRLAAEDSATTLAPDDAGPDFTPPGSPPRRMVLGLLAGMLGAIALGAALGYEGGAFARVGEVVWTGIVWAIVGMAVVLAVLATPLSFLLRGLHLNLAAGLQRVAAQIRRVGGRGKPKPGPPLELPWLGRVLGLLAVILIVTIVWRLIRRHRHPPDWELGAHPGSGTVAISGTGRLEVPPPQPRRRRVDLPRDTVRRWYAELLILLEGRGLTKPGPVTPREYVGMVAAAFPDGQAAFESMTRAYEEVRYAGRTPDRTRLRALRADRESAAAVIRKAKRADVPDEDEDQDDGGADDQGSAQR